MFSIKTTLLWHQENGNEYEAILYMDGEKHI